MTAIAQLEKLLDRHTADDVADAALLTGLTLIENACAAARRSLDFRWRSHPRGELRALRRGVRIGLELCRFAAYLADADRDEDEVRLAHELALEARRAKARHRSR